MTIERNDILAVIPTYNNEKTLARVIGEVRRYCTDVLVVNDGSTDSTAGIIAGAGVGSISYAPNRGKGYALRRALRYAAEHGYRYMLTIDSDGQHYASDIPKFVEEIAKTPDALLVGARNLRSDNMPGKNTFANKFSNFWFRVETGIRLDDTQSGFRLYPVRRMKGMRFATRRYEFEVEVLVRAAWRGIEVRNIPVRVFYPEKAERVSHFRPGKDFTRISILNTLLVLGALLFYYPWRFLRSLTRERVRRFIADNITRSKDSNPRLAASIGLGVFFGIAPLWGYQMIAAAVTAHFTHLNKAVAVISSNISIPPMIPFILYGSYWTGAQVLQRDMPLSLSDITLERVAADLVQYTTFEYSDLYLSALTPHSFEVSCKIRNTGKYDGEEVVQLYLRDEYASVVQPLKQLKHFARLFLKCGEEQEVKFILSEEDFALVDRNLKRVVEPGTFQVMIGAASDDIRLQTKVEIK